MCADPHASKKWICQVYSQAKSAIAADGDGLGRCFIEQFMPSPPHSHTLQNALDSHYAERRKAAAERRKAIAEEQQRQAEAERAEREAAARQAQAKETHARRKAIYEKLHPETRQGGDRGNQHTGGKSRQTDNLSVCQSYAADAANAVGDKAPRARG